MSYNVAQIKVLPWNIWIRNTEDHTSIIHIVTEGLAEPPTRVTESGLTSLFLTLSAGRPADLQPSMEAAAGCTTPEWKLILFTFNLLFPPLWNLERAKSCNTYIKNKCSRNGPTGHNAVRGFCGLAKKACGEKQSIRPIFQHVLLNNNNPQSDLDLFQRK